MAQYRTHIPGQSHLSATKQRGVALIFTAFILLGLVAAVGLAIEVGRLYAEQQNLQTAANIAAIEAARVVSGCESGVPDNPQAAAQAAAQTSVTRNYSNRGDGNTPTAVVNLGAAQPDPGNPGLRVFRTNSALPAPAAGVQPEDNSAVQVVLKDTYKPLLFRLFSGSDLQATAAARNAPTATFQVGSSLLRLNPQFLGPLGIDAGVFDQGALADATLSLGALATQLGVATPDDLLTTSLPLQDLVAAIDAVSGGALGGLSGALNSSVGSTVVTLGDVLVSSGPIGASAQAVAAPLADALLQAALAQRGDAINLPIGGINILGLAGTTATVRILQPPQIAIGVRPGLPSSQASSGQLLVQLGLNINLNIPLLARVTGDLPIYIRAGQANAQLRNIYCANSTQPFHQVAISAQSDTTSLGIGRFDDLTRPNPVPQQGGSLRVALLLSIVRLNLGIQADPVSLGQAGDPVAPLRPLYNDPPATPGDNTRTISAGLRPGDAIVDLTSGLKLTLNGGSVGLLNAISPLLSTLLNALALDNTLNTLLTGLGVNMGAAEVELLGTNVAQPELFQATSGDASDAGGGSGNPTGGGGTNSGGGGTGTGGAT